MNEQIVQQAFYDELEKIAISTQSVLAGTERAIGVIPKPILNGVEKLKSLLRGEGLKTRRDVKPIYTWNKQASLAADMFKGVGNGMAAGRTTEAIGNLVRKAFSNKVDIEALRKARFPHGIHTEQDAGAFEDILNVNKIEQKAKEEAAKKTMGHVGEAVTAAGVLYGAASPLMSHLSQASRAADHAKLQKKLLMGLGIGSAGTIGGIAIGEALNNQEKTTYTL